MKNALLCTIAIVLTACASSTRIQVSDPSARILVNGEYIGTGQGRYRDRRPAFTRQEVALRKEGCKEQTYSFRRNERPDIGAIVGAYFLYLPVFWVAQYKNQHEYEFDCLNESDVVIEETVADAARPSG
jgi:hypothetical protein